MTTGYRPPATQLQLYMIQKYSIEDTAQFNFALMIRVVNKVLPLMSSAPKYALQIIVAFTLTLNDGVEMVEYHVDASYKLKVNINELSFGCSLSVRKAFKHI
jgi:hypothetical protein